MNALSHNIELSVQRNQAEEAILALFHTIVYHRAEGKFIYNGDKYHASNLAFEDHKCNTIDLDYVKCKSPLLHSSLQQEVNKFVSQLPTRPLPTTGLLSLQFYEKKKTRFFSSENIAWEIWNVNVTIERMEEDETEAWSRVGKSLRSHMFSLMNNVLMSSYKPPVPPKAELDLVYNTRYQDIQLYLYKVVSQVNPSNPTTFSTSNMKRIIKDIAIS